MAGALSIAAILLAATFGFAEDSTLPRTSVIFELSRPIESQQNFNWFVRPPSPPKGEPERASRRESGAHQAMWEPLFVLDRKTGELEGWLAEKIEANAAMDEWTLTLRDGIEWSDGKAFDAGDVIHTVKMALLDDTLSALEAAEMRSALKSGSSVVDGKVVYNGVEQGGDLTVIFKLRKPDPRFALKHFGGAMFGSFLIMPQHKWPSVKTGKHGREFFDPPVSQFVWKDPIGTGPYGLESYDMSKVVWKRRTEWWGVGEDLGGMSDPAELPEPEKLIWQPVADETASRTLLVNDELDAARAYSRETFLAARSANPAIVGWSDPVPPLNPGSGPATGPAPSPVDAGLAWAEPCTRQLEINTKVEPWNDPRMRKALSLLIDRKKLAEIGYGGTTTPARTMFYETGAMTPVIEAVAENFGLPEQANIAEAERLLSEVGYSKTPGVYHRNDKPLTAAITVNDSIPTDKRAVDELKAQLSAAGLETVLQSVSNAEYWGRDIPTGDYALAYGWLSCGSVAEPYTSMARYRKSTAIKKPLGARTFNNTGRWDSEASAAFEVTLDEIAALPVGDAAIPDLVAKAYKHIDEDTPFIPLVQTPRIVPFNTTNWTGWPSAATGGVPMYTSGDAHLMIHKLKKR
jgi:peptide/nickel transport system substrate-binding protein